MEKKTEEQLSSFMQEVLGYLKELVHYRRPVKPYAKLVTGTETFSIPDGVKSFNIINLGQNSGSSTVYQDVPITGITGITSIPAALDSFAYSLEHDQNKIVGPITVSPPSGHRLLVQYLL